MENLLNKIHFADCLDVLRQIPDGSVDLLLQDMPYGVTQNKWDILPELNTLWAEWLRVGKKDAAFVFTGQQPFSAELILSQKRFFKYELIWEKSITTGFLNAEKQPLRAHENVLIFYAKQPTYNPQKTKAEKPYYRKTHQNGRAQNQTNYGNFNHQNSKNKDPFAYPKSVFKVKSDAEFFDSSTSGKRLHPTQKPTDLFRYLIRTYSNPGDVVFDGYGGSGTTAIAAQMEGRKFIVCENHLPYFEASQARLANLVAAPYLFSNCG